MALQGYVLPQNRYIEPQPAVAPATPLAGPELGLPALTDNYANVQGITDEFIDTVGQLKTYAHDMAKTYGIDVTRPDIGRPGGGQPYRTFQELSAKAIMTGGDLKRRAKENEAINKGVLEGTVIGQGDYEQAPLETSIQDRAVSVKLLPEVEAAARTLMKGFDTPGAATRADAAFRQPLVDKLTALIQNDPQNAVFYQRQIDALPHAVYEPPVFAPSTTAAGKAQKEEAIVDLYKRTTNLIKGAFEEGNYETELDENFNPVFVNRELSGTPLGEKSFVVKNQNKKYQLIADGIEIRDGKVFLTFQQPEEAKKDKFVIPAEDITGTRGDLFLKRMIQYNKGIGVNTTELVTALKNAKLYAETGSKDDEVVRKDLVRTSADASDVKKAVQDLKTIMSLSKGGEILNTTLPNGQQVKVSKRSNILGTKYDISIDGTTGTGDLDFITDQLREAGYFNQYIKTPVQEQQAESQADRLPNETEGAYRLRLLRAKQAANKK